MISQMDFPFLHNKHATHRMRANSRQAYHSEKNKLNERSAIVLQYLSDNGPATDRVICEALKFPDMNCVRPRCTELIDAGLVQEIGKRRCHVTAKQVRILQVVKK